jgi:single-strand DNA-binding protein
MSEGLNKVMLLGNLGADPELRMTNGGQPVLKLRLATSETFLDRDKQKQERTEWHNVVIWGKRGEALSRILTKGSRLFVEGGLRTTSYEKDGVKLYRTEIIASNVLLQGGGAGRDAREARAAIGGSERPAGMGRMGGMPSPRMPSPAFFPAEPPDDDLPF